MTKGVFTVRSADGAKTAKAGEVLFLTKGTKLVSVTYPHWFDAQRMSKHANLLDSFHPA